MSTENKPRIEVRYCPKCGWLLRAAWMAQELLTTFGEDVSEVALVPSSPGTFDFLVNGTAVFSRKTDGRFPDVKELKQRVRDHVAPGRDLGHLDR